MPSDDRFRRDLSATLATIEGMLGELPSAVAKQLRIKLRDLREILVERRAPRFVLVGRRGSGKSSLVNALYGEEVATVGHVKAQTGAPRWFTYERREGQLDFLDTRGFQEAHRPAEDDGAASALESILLELEKKSPDAVLFLVKATEVGAAIDADLDETEALLERLRRRHGAKIPLICIVTQCDLLEPKDVALHEPEAHDAADVQEKRERVKKVERLLEDQVRSRKGLRDHFVSSLGIGAYQSWRPDGSRRSDQRWRVDDLVSFLFDKLPQQARMELVRVARVRHLQRRMARSLTALVASMCAGLAASPIPMGDIGPITSLQVALVVAIGYVGGREPSTKTAHEFLGAIGVNVGIGFALRETARALVKFVFPGAGSFVSASVAFGGTWAVGSAAMAYFIDGASIAEARRRGNQARDAESRHAASGDDATPPSER
ncbi:MAG: GTPase [Myxococcota bacterium]